MNKYSLLLGLIFLYVAVCESKKQETCPPAYSHCNAGKDGFINVHIVPHTHDDVGWLKTIDQYYYGSNNKEQEATVQYVLDTVVTELVKNPDRRFVYVEMAYFWRWWKEQDNTMKDQVRELVNEGRLEFVIGAWCMNDEAGTYYNDIIDQQTLGLKFIKNEFGSCARPRSAWQVDPFGHSREQASLFAQFGFDGLFLGRVDYQDKNFRAANKSREFIWQASANLDNKASLFTGVLPNRYSAPSGFCFDANCEDEPIIDDSKLDEYNVDKKVDQFIQYIFDERKDYISDSIMMTMGDDFQYSDALMYFKNLDKLIYYVNQRQITNNSKVNIFYSTPACYLYSLYKENITWPTKTDDFFPYAHRPHSFWTGYFTSRAALKDYVRKTNNYLQAVRQLSSLADLNDQTTIDSLGVLERAMGVLQHHDAVAGTERQHVANDYAKRLAKGVNLCVDVISKAFNNILSKYILNNDNKESQQPVFYCSLLNITECLPIEGQNEYSILVYNPLAREVDSWIRIPTVTNDYKVYEGDSPTALVLDFVSVDDETKMIPERQSKAEYSMVFKASLAPLGIKAFRVTKSSSTNNESNKKHDNKKTNLKNIMLNKKKPSKNDNIVMKNEHLELQFDSNANLLSINNLDTLISSNLAQQFCYYLSMRGNNSDGDFQASGAYVFRPQTNNATCLTVQKYNFYQGKQVQELHQIYNEFISQTIRLYDGSTDVEFEWQVGPIKVDDLIGKEIITKFKSDLNSKSSFYTDSNGREMLKRVIDSRAWPNFEQTEAVSGNYYPINSRIYIIDENDKRQITLVTDRSQGGTSIQDGSIEIMVHRRNLNDDALGVSEPLNETGVDHKGLIIKGKHYLIFNSTSNSARLHRSKAHMINMQPLITFATATKKSKYELSNTNKLFKLSGWNPLKLSFPENIELLTLMKDYEDGQVQNTLIARLEHFYELNEDSTLSQPVNVDLQSFFNQTINLIGIEELALGANMNVDELNERLVWNSDSQNSNLKSTYSKKTDSCSMFEFTFQPMEIKTFRLWYLPK